MFPIVHDCVVETTIVKKKKNSWSLLCETKENHMSIWKLAISLLTKIVSQGRLYWFIYIIIYNMYHIYIVYMSLDI